MGRRTNGGRHTIAVSVYDRVAEQSISFTVFTDAQELTKLVQRLHDAASVHYRTTSLNSRRHKRR